MGHVHDRARLICALAVDVKLTRETSINVAHELVIGLLEIGQQTVRNALFFLAKGNVRQVVRAFLVAERHDPQEIREVPPNVP